jgi:hypothetical protein
MLSSPCLALLGVAVAAATDSPNHIVLFVIDDYVGD